MKRASENVNRALKKESTRDKQKGEETREPFPAKEGSATNKGRGNEKPEQAWGMPSNLT